MKFPTLQLKFEGDREVPQHKIVTQSVTRDCEVPGQSSSQLQFFFLNLLLLEALEETMRFHSVSTLRRL